MPNMQIHFAQQFDKNIEYVNKNSTASFNYAMCSHTICDIWQADLTHIFLANIIDLVDEYWLVWEWLCCYYLVAMIFVILFAVPTCFAIYFGGF